MKVKRGLSPFKAEVATYIKKNSVVVDEYKTEIEMLSNLSEKNIAGVITTNYDEFIENHFLGYTKFVGQKQLIFSPIQGIAEVFKIHGSIEDPDSLIINEKDYLDFDRKSAYLAAKLMTIFIEYPIIFMGYSISDVNIQKIIKSIIDCLDVQQIKTLEDEDFKLLYRALEGKRSKLPVRILRRFKQELYDFTVTNKPTANMRVASIEDERVQDEELVMAIGKYNDFGLKGLHGLKADEWYKNIVVEDIEFSADDLLQYAFKDLVKQNSGRLPVNKYLSKAKGNYPDCVELAKKQDFDYIISKTIKKNRYKLDKYKTVKQIWENEKDSLEKATRLIAHLPEKDINVEELEIVLNEIFENDINILQDSKPAIRTNIRRLIMIYDYLKWGK